MKRIQYLISCEMDEQGAIERAEIEAVVPRKMSVATGAAVEHLSSLLHQLIIVVANPHDPDGAIERQSARDIH